jgi:hypothetical protein
MSHKHHKATSISSANGSVIDKTDSSKLNDTKTNDKQDETDQATLDPLGASSNLTAIQP